MIGASKSIAPTPSPARTADDVVRLALDRLASNEHFAHHLDTVHVSFEHGRLVLAGRVPSFYLKSVLQNAVGALPAGCRVDNRVDVVCCDGVSTTRPSHGRARR